MNHHNLEVVKHTMDGLSLTTILASLVGYLPELSAGAALVWTLIRIWETRTVRKLMDRLAKWCPLKK